MADRCQDIAHADLHASGEALVAMRLELVVITFYCQLIKKIEKYKYT